MSEAQNAPSWAKVKLTTILPSLQGFRGRLSSCLFYLLEAACLPPWCWLPLNERLGARHQSCNSPGIWARSQHRNHFWGKDKGYYWRTRVLEERRGFPRPEIGLLSNTQKWIVQRDTCADKARSFLGKRCPGGKQQIKGTQEDVSAMWLAVLGFMVMRLVSGLSLTNYLDSRSFLVVDSLFSQDGCVRGVCNFLGFISLLQKFEVTDQCYSPQMDQCYSSMLQLSFI